VLRVTCSWNVWVSVTPCYLFHADSMARNGDVEMTARQEEIRFLKMQLAEEQRTVALLKKSLPSKKTIENELVTLQIQV